MRTSPRGSVPTPREYADGLLRRLQTLQIEFDAEETSEERLVANIDEQIMMVNVLHTLGVDDVTIQAATHAVAKDKDL